MLCPKCKAECLREEVDIGVGIQYGPWYCTECSWNQEEEDIDKMFREGGKNERTDQS